MRIPARLVVKPLLLAGSILLLQTNVHAQSSKKPRPDLSGTWIMDRSKSSRAINFDETLVIEHRDPEIRITRKITTTAYERVDSLTYYSNGSGEVNPSELTGKPAKTKTKWGGNKLVTNESRITRANDMTVYLEVTDVWQISTDGRVLTHRTSPKMRPAGNAMIIAEGETDTTRVFVRDLNQPAKSP